MAYLGKRKLRRNRHITSKNHGHRHTWSKKNKRTSVNAGHSHPINLKLKLAQRGKTDHTHRLLLK